MSALAEYSRSFRTCASCRDSERISRAIRCTTMAAAYGVRCSHSHSAHSEDVALDFSSPIEQKFGLRQHIDHRYVQNARVLIQLKMLGNCGLSGAGSPSRNLGHSGHSVTTVGARHALVVNVASDPLVVPALFVATPRK